MFRWPYSRNTVFRYYLQYVYICGSTGGTGCTGVRKRKEGMVTMEQGNRCRDSCDAYETQNAFSSRMAEIRSV